MAKFPWLRITHWKKDRDGYLTWTEPPDREDRNKECTAVVELNGGYPEWRFSLPSQRYEMEKLLSGLERAHGYGRANKAAEIRDCLQI